LPGGKPPPVPRLLAYQPALPAPRLSSQPRPAVEVDLSAIDQGPGFTLRPPPTMAVQAPTFTLRPPSTVSGAASHSSSVTVDLGSLD